jgi:cytochrome c
MKKTLLIGLLFASSTAALADTASSNAQSIVKKSDCMTCHAVDKKIIGPSFKDIATKYKGNPKAVELLVQKVKVGGAGSWGTMAMSPHPGLSDADITTVVKWILSGAK